MMITSQQSKPTARLKLPRPDGAIVDTIFSAIIAFFVAVAFYNLANCHVLPLYAIVPSLIWLLIVTSSVYFTLKDDHGIRNLVVNRLAPFSRHHFVEVFQQADGNQMIRFCFTLLKCQLTLFRIPASKIASVQWSPGQATSLAGRDMNDWHVVVWYHQKGAKRWISPDDSREEGLYIVGPSGPKTRAATIGNALVAFLESAGVTFFPTPSNCEFTTSNPTANKSLNRSDS